MRNRLFVSVLVLVSVCLTASAQNTRLVRGIVVDASRSPIKGAVVQAEGSEQKMTTGVDGTFQMSIPTYVKNVKASMDGFLTESLEVDGSYLMFTLKVDKDYEKRLRAQAEQREKAAKQEAERAEKERLAAQKAEEEKRAAEEKAAKMEAERAERERIAAQKAEEERRAAEERLRVAEEKRVAAEAKAAASKSALAEYDSEYKNHGLVFGVDFSYGYQLSKGSTCFMQVGEREYGDLMPLSATVSVGWRFNYLCSVSAGAGLLYHIRSMSVRGDTFISNYSGFTEKQLDVPVFANLKLFMSRSKVQPLLSLSGGLYLLTMTPMLDGGFGFNIRTGRSSSLQILAGASTTPWPYFVEEPSDSGYRTAITPGLKIGFTF